MSFYENLKSVCDEKGLKVTPVVKECGGATGSISAWKNGAYPNSDTVVKLSVRLNVSCDRLLIGPEGIKKDPSSEISENGREMLALFERLEERQQILLIGRMQEMVEPTVTCSTLAKSHNEKDGSKVEIAI